MLACRVFGHRWRFHADGEEMRWDCERGCGAGGSKRYATAAEARRYAEAFDRDDRPASRRRPALSTAPLLFARRGRRRRSGG